MAARVLGGALAAAAAASAQQLAATVASDGSYSVSMGGSVWLASSPTNPYVFRWDGVTRSAASGGLTVSSVTPVSGTDPALGAYSGWEVSLNSGKVLARTLNVPGRNAVLFEQVFPGGLAGTAYNTSESTAAADQATSFPVFGPPMAQVDSSLAYLAFAHCMCGAATGSWTAKGLKANSGHFGDEGGAFSIFDANFSTVVISAANDFMTTTIGFPDATGTALGSGFNGMLTGIPAGWTHRTILVGGAGVNETWYAWGDALLALGGKRRTPTFGNFFDTLSYWTDK